MAIFRREPSRGVWVRITTEVAVAGLLMLFVALSLATPVSRAGWLLVVLPAAGAYLVAVGFTLIRPRGSLHSRSPHSSALRDAWPTAKMEQ